MSDFLLDMIDSQKYVPDTLDGIKSCVCITIKLASGHDYTQNAELSAIIAKYHLDCPKERFEVPEWNLALVLQALLKAPFEPLHTASLKHLTYKTVFLVGMSSACRISELHALDARKIVHDADWLNVWLEPNSLFMAKTQKDRKLSSTRQIKIPNLSQFVGPHEPDRLLCPVRALRYYLDRTKHMRAHKKCLFISLQPGRKSDITKQSINIWFRNTIKLAYALSGEQDQKLGRVSAHAVRSLVSSLAFERSLSLAAVLKACHWRNNTTFTTYYLKDVTVLSNDLMRLSPMVVASTVINKVIILGFA